MAARILGPSDSYDQTQPKTLAYTTDMLVSGQWSRWILPLAWGDEPATKPPLYNWLAAPVVRLAGFSCELAHKWPSVAALVLCWAALVWLGRGRGLDPHGGDLGWLASMFFVSNYTIFKLGYLARPDMLLTLWLLVGWMAATALLADSTSTVESESTAGKPTLPLRLIFWLCVGLAGLSKGPPALVLILYALIGARVVAGRWRASGNFGWSWGLPLALTLTGLWIFGVWRINPDHLENCLWQQEIYDRVMGIGRPGGGRGPIGLVTELPMIAMLFVVRFSPWWLFLMLGLARLWRRDRKSGLAFWRVAGRMAESRAHGTPGTPGTPGAPGDAGAPGAPGYAIGHWLQGAAVYVVITILFFTLSTGKRADYVAGAFAPASVIAAWWLLRVSRRWFAPALWLGPVAAAVTLCVMTIVNQRQPQAQVAGFGDQIMQFVFQVQDVLVGEPREVAFFNTGRSHMKAMLGFSEPEPFDRVEKLIAAGRPFWLISGRATPQSEDFGKWLAHDFASVRVTVKLRSAEQVEASGWPTQMTLYDVSPAEVKPNSQKAKQPNSRSDSAKP